MGGSWLPTRKIEEETYIQGIGDMKNPKELAPQLHNLFNPKSVAIVGLPRGMKMGKFFLMALQDQDYAGDIYPGSSIPDLEKPDGAYPCRSTSEKRRH